MAVTTNCTKNGKNYFRIKRKIGMKLNKNGVWVDNYKEFYGKSKSEAIEKYNKFMEQHANSIVNKGRYLGMIADFFIDNIFIPNSRYSKGTKENYINTWNKYVRGSELCGRPLEQITSADIQVFYNTLDCSPGALNTINKFMKLIYKYLEKEGYCKNITTSLMLPIKETTIDSKEENENIIEVWSGEEVEKILNGSQSHRLRFLIVLALNTGLRISELLGLKYSDFEEDTLNVQRQLKYNASFSNVTTVSHAFELVPPKYNSCRAIPLNSFVLSELSKHKLWHQKEMLKNSYRTDFIFTSSSGEFLDRKNVGRSLARLYKKIGVDNKGVHTYRRTFGTNLCSVGVPIQTASKLLGHSDISVTAKYYVNISHDEKLDAVNKLLDAYNV